MTISPDNPDNRTDLQAAIDSLSAGGGGELVIGPGRYEFSIDPATTQGIKLKSGVRLVGEGNPTLAIKQGSTLASPNAAVWAVSATDIGIRDLTIDGLVDLSGTPAGQTTCLELRTVDGLTLNNVTFKGAISDGFASGGYGVVCWYGSTDNATITNCHFQDIGQSDLGLFWGTNWGVTNCDSTNTGYCPINVESTGGATIADVLIDGWTIDGCEMMALSAIQNASSTVADVTIKNVTAVGAHRTTTYYSIGGCRVRGTTRTTLENISIDGCKSHPLYVTVDGGYACNDLTVRNLFARGIESNVPYAIRSHGVWLQGTTSLGVVNPTLVNVVTQQPTAENFLAEFATNLRLDAISTIAGTKGGMTLVGSTAKLFDSTAV